MDELVLQRLKRRAGEKRDRSLSAAREKIELEYAADLASIERLAALDSMEDGQPYEDSPRLAPVDLSAPQKIGPAPAVREAIEAQRGPFTINHIEDFIQKIYPEAGISKPGISSALSKQVGKLIRTVRPKAGRVGAVYQKIVNPEIIVGATDESDLLSQVL
jgi:hypothetical protein